METGVVLRMCKTEKRCKGNFSAGNSNPHYPHNIINCYYFSQSVNQFHE